MLLIYSDSEQVLTELSPLKVYHFLKSCFYFRYLLTCFLDTVDSCYLKLKGTQIFNVV